MKRGDSPSPGRRVPRDVFEPGDLPPRVEALVRAWRSRGSPGQQPSPWPRENWLEEFPDDAGLLEGLPDLLDRETVRAACAQTQSSEAGAREAFLISMAWGYGTTGYGPYRTSHVLSDRRAPAKLREAREAASLRGALAGYRFLAGPGRISGLGPAFGTKFLYFAGGREAGALILDRIVAGSFTEFTGIDLHPTNWRTEAYGGYLAIMDLWAEELGVEPEELEQVIFVDASTRMGNQWAE